MIGFRRLPGRNDENDTNIGETSPCPNRRTTRAPPDQVKALPFQQSCLAEKVLVPTESVHTFQHLGKLINCQGYRCTATGWFFQMLGVAAMGDTRWQLKQEIGVPAALPHGPQLVSNDTAYATNPTLTFQCNRLDPFHVTGQTAIKTHTVRQTMLPTRYAHRHVLVLS